MYLTKVNAKNVLRNIGPSLITAALIFGPGSLTVTTKLGAGYAYQLLWVIALCVVFMVAYTQLSAHIGLTIDGTLINEVREIYGRWTAIFLGVGIFLISASFQAGNAIGAGVSLQELFGSSAPVWIVLISATAIFLLFFQTFYQILERIMIALVLIMLLCFLITVILSAPNLVQIFSGFRPAIPRGSELLMIALVASSFSIVGAFYQSSLVKEKGWKLADLQMVKQESIVGIVTLGILSSLVMICAASVLFQSGIDVRNAQDLSEALTPLFGRFSSVAFMIGFLAASFSSLLGNATIGGALLADSLSMGQSLGSRRVRLVIVLVILSGSTIAIIFGRLPLELIVFAQAVTILLAPAAAISMLLIGNKKGLLKWQKSRAKIIVLGLGLLTLITLALYNFNHIFIK